MITILIQLAMIMIIVGLIKDIYHNHTYPKWGILIYVFILYCEYSGFYNLLQLPNQYFLKFLNGVTMFLLGSLYYMLIKFYKRKN